MTVTDQITKETTVIKVVARSRRNFYEGRPIYWYQFDGDLSLIPDKFLRVPYTIYYEFGGSHQEAIAELTKVGITDIVEGDEL